MNLVENSLIFSGMYERNVREVKAHGIIVKSWNLAKHRADSTQVPQGRLIITHEALVKTAEEVSLCRDGLEEELADRFITDSGGLLGAEEHVMSGMMADMGDEAMLLQRFCDDDDLDPAEAPFEV